MSVNQYTDEERVAIEEAVAKAVTSVAAETWTSEWPVVPGVYLFYGAPRGSTIKPFFMICHAITQASPGLAYVAGNMFLYRAEMIGKWKPFTEEPPADWDRK